MDLTALKTFCAVVEDAGVQRAATRLHTVQSNVTMRIRRLERELGTSLFVKRGRRLVLTPSGKVLLDYAHRILQLERQAAQAVKQAGDIAGELRLGANQTFAALNLPVLLKTLQQYHPRLEINLILATSGHLVQQVLDHKLDCAFVGGPVDHPELEVEEVYREELVLVDTPQGTTVHRLIVFHEGCAYRARALQWQRETGHPFRPFLELGTLDGILGCVAAGLGVTLLPRQAVERSLYREQLRVTALPRELAEVPALFIRHRDGFPLAAIDTARHLATRLPSGVATGVNGEENRLGTAEPGATVPELERKRRTYR